MSKQNEEFEYTVPVEMGMEDPLRMDVLVGWKRFKANKRDDSGYVTRSYDAVLLYLADDGNPNDNKFGLIPHDKPEWIDMARFQQITGITYDQMSVEMLGKPCRLTFGRGTTGTIVLTRCELPGTFE